MLCPWMVTSATRPSSTAWTKRLKLTSGSRGCCLVTIDQSRTPMSSRRSQRPRLRETGFNAFSGRRRKPLRRVTYDPRSGNARSSVPTTTRRVPGPRSAAELRTTPATHSTVPPPTSNASPPRASRGTWASTSTSWSLRVPTRARCTRSPGRGVRTSSVGGSASASNTARVGPAPARSSALAGRGAESASTQRPRGSPTRSPGAIGASNGSAGTSRPGRHQSQSPSRTTRAGPGTASGPRARPRARSRTRSTWCAAAVRPVCAVSQACTIRRPRAGGEEALLVVEARGERGQLRAEAGIEFRFEPGHEQPPHAVAHVAEVGVAAVDREVETALGEKAPHVGARHREQRPPEKAAAGTHARKAAAARAAEQAEEDRLDLIVAGVTGDDARGCRLPGERFERRVAGPPGARLDARPGGDGRLPPAKGYAERVGEARRALAVGGALRPAQSVVDVGCRQAQAALGGELRQRGQQRRRVRTARNGDEQLRAASGAVGPVERGGEAADEDRRRHEAIVAEIFAGVWHRHPCRHSMGTNGTATPQRTARAGRGRAHGDERAPPPRARAAALGPGSGEDGRDQRRAALRAPGARGRARRFPRRARRPHAHRPELRIRRRAAARRAWARGAAARRHRCPPRRAGAHRLRPGRAAPRPRARAEAAARCPRAALAPAPPRARPHAPGDRPGRRAGRRAPRDVLRRGRRAPGSPETSTWLTAAGRRCRSHRRSVPRSPACAFRAAGGWWADGCR